MTLKLPPVFFIISFILLEVNEDYFLLNRLNRFHNLTRVALISFFRVKYLRFSQTGEGPWL